MDKILVTGVAGFIGSNLAQKLLENENNTVYGIDNFSSSTMSNLYPLLKSDNFIYEEHDLTNPLKIKVDKVYHFAGNGDLRHYFIDKYDFILNQITITKNIVSLCEANGAKLVLPTSYTDFSHENEELSKLFNYLKLAQDLILERVLENKLDAAFARIDSVYGEYMQFDDLRFLPQTIKSVLKNEEIVIEEDSSHYFTYVKDVVNNLIKLMNNYVSSPIVDVINPNLYLKSDLIKLTINYLKSSSNLKIISQNVNHPTYKPNLAVLDNNLQISCPTPVLEGMIKTIQHFKLMHFD